MSNPKLSFSVISDTHITKDDKQSHIKLERALSDLKEISSSPDHVIVLNGDITNDGSSQSYSKLKEILSKYNWKNFYYTIGNHEFFKKDGNTNSINRFLSFTGLSKVYFERQITGYPFIFLGTESWGSEESLQKDSAVLSNAQLTWLEKTLLRNKKLDLPTFVFLHQPIPYILPGSDLPYYQKCIIQDRELMNVLRQYKQIFYFSGHSHWDLRLPGMLQKEPFVVANTGSVYNTYGPDGQGHETITDRNGSQGLHVTVYENKVIIKGRDFHRKQWIEEINHTIYL